MSTTAWISTIATINGRISVFVVYYISEHKK